MLEKPGSIPQTFVASKNLTDSTVDFIGPGILFYNNAHFDTS